MISNKSYRVSKVFSDRAENWDKKGSHILSSEGNTNRINDILDELVEKHSIVMDIGSGSGRTIRKIIELNKGIMCIACDISGDMLKHCVNIFGNVAELSALRMDARDMPLASESVDVIVMKQVLHHLDDIGAVLREVERVLKRKGKVVVLAVGRGYQHNIVPYCGLGINEDPLGRLNAKSLLDLFSSKRFYPYRFYNDEFKFQFAGIKPYIKFLDAIGALSRILDYSNPNVDDFLLKYGENIRASMHGGVLSVAGEYLTLVCEKE